MVLTVGIIVKVKGNNKYNDNYSSDNIFINNSNSESIWSLVINGTGSMTTRYLTCYTIEIR